MLNNLNIKKMVENKEQFLKNLKEKYSDVYNIRDYIIDIETSLSNLECEYEIREENEELRYNLRSKEQLEDMESDAIELIEMLIKESLNNMF
jgi:predicted nuclease with TOPRIM domain